MADLGVQERVLELHRVPVLRPLAMPVLVEIAHAMDVDRVRRGHSIAGEGGTPRSIAWVLEGRADWTRRGRALGCTAPGASIGLLEVLARCDSAFTARASTSLRVARIGSDRFEELLEDSFDLAMGLLSAIAGDLAQAGRRTLGLGPILGVPELELPGSLDFTESLVRLRASRPFTGAPIRSLAALAQRCEIARWPRGARLWESGSDARELVVILAGELREGVTRLSRGETAGLIDVLASRPREAPAIARTPVTGLVIGLEVLVDVLEDQDDLARQLLSACAAELLALRIERGQPPEITAKHDDRSAPSAHQ